MQNCVNNLSYRTALAGSESEPLTNFEYGVHIIYIQKLLCGNNINLRISFTTKNISHPSNATKIQSEPKENFSFEVFFSGFLRDR